MTVRLLLFLSSALAATALFAASGNPNIRAPAPVKNFSLPFFNDAGFRTRLIRGNEARLADPRKPVLSDVTISLFTGDESNRVTTVLLSTDATVDTEGKIVTGEGAVRLVRDDFELSGEQWRYDYNEADTIQINIRRKARVVLQAQLESILK